ncbi:type IV secretory system conjugative DNA transfer family protein [Brevibacillus migulae]|uniref:ATP-binding protein n=1 Tax=Brevibacillus migulae TaxID=1644114 RepID=UPI00106E6C12|nr:ATP-binding protein [Brevibacillus migulae]
MLVSFPEERITLTYMRKGVAWEKVEPIYPEVAVAVEVQDNIQTIVHNEPVFAFFQITPHSTVKNDYAHQFAEIIADGYQEFYRLVRSRAKRQDMIFMESTMTNGAYKSHIVTLPALKDTIRAQAQSIWRHSTIKEATDPLEDLSAEQVLCYDLRLRFPHFLSLKTDRRLQEKPLGEILELSRFLQENDKVYIQFGIQPAETMWYKEAEQDRKVFEKEKPRSWKKSKEISDATDKKLSQAGFDFTLRLVVRSEDVRRQLRIMRGLIVAFKQLDHDNELVGKKVPKYRVNHWIRKMKDRKIDTPFLFGRRNLVSGEEAGHFFKLPQHSLQEDYPIIDTINHPEVDLPKEVTKSGLFLGTATFKGEKIPVYKPTKNWDLLCLPDVVIGPMGCGKTEGYAANAIVEMVKAGYGGIVIDPAKGQIGDQVEKVLPPEKVMRIRLGEKPIGLDWREVLHAERAKQQLAGIIMGVFQDINEDAPETERHIKAAVYGMQTGRLQEILEIFEDDAHREKIIRQMPDGMHKTTLIEFGKESPAMRRKILRPIYNRLDCVLGDAYLEECMRTRAGLDFVELFKMRKAIIIDVPVKKLGAAAVDLLVNILCTKADAAMTLRPDNDDDPDMFPFLFLMDEPHQYLRAKKIWKGAAVTSRKWRIKYTWMFHSFEQLPADLVEIIKSAGPNYHLYASSKETYNKLKEEIVPFKPEQAIKLPRFHAINIIRSDSGMLRPFIAKMALPPAERFSS